MKHGRLLHLGVQAALQLVRLEAQQEAHGDGAQRQQQAQSQGETGQPAGRRELSLSAVANRFMLFHRLAGCSIHNLFLD